jgi:hypothetical protein
MEGRDEELEIAISKTALDELRGRCRLAGRRE